MRHVVLLRGINLGASNRIAMTALREALPYDDVATYLQSGNVVLTSPHSAKRVAADVHAVIAERFGLDIPVFIRTRDELARVAERNPLKRVAGDPKRYQVTFLESKPSKSTVEKLEAQRAHGEELAVDGREVYAWHPDGIARSKLSNALARLDGTSRNWTTVTKLLDLADG